MSQPLQPRHIEGIRNYIALMEQNGSMTMSGVHARDLLREVDWLRGRLAEFAADVNQLITDYSDEDRGVIAHMAFAATFDQLAYEKYGISLDGGES